MSLTLQQMGEAMRLVGWSPADLAREAMLNEGEVAAWLGGGSAPSSHALERLKLALEAKGVSFTAAGVALDPKLDDTLSIPVGRMNSENDR